MPGTCLFPFLAFAEYAFDGVFPLLENFPVVSIPAESINPIHLRPTVMDISLDNLEHNYLAIQSAVGSAEVMPIVKSNAYGHGLVACGRHLERVGARCLGVALLEEGIQLRQGGVKIPILVLGGIFGSQVKYFLDYDLDLLASSVFKLDTIEEVAKAAGKRARVHLEIDTGMERIGVHYYTADSLLERAKRCTHADIVGVSSHFATADDPDPAFAKVQLERFLGALKDFPQSVSPHPRRHIAASAAIISLPESHLDMVRPGVLLYGVTPAPHLDGKIDLKPVMSLRSKVVYFKVVRAGDAVSYGLTWTAPTDTRVITVPIGYGDGYVRKLSNRGQVLIRGKRYPVVGRVCMDQLMVNIGPDGVAYNGDEVVLLGEQEGEVISVADITKHLDGNPREFLVSTNLRIPRRYHYRGEITLA